MSFEVIKKFDAEYSKLPSLSMFKGSTEKWAIIAQHFNLYHLKVITPLNVGKDDSYVSNFIRSVGPSVMYPLVFSQVVFGYAFRSLADKNFILLSYSPLYVYSSFRSMKAVSAGEKFVWGTTMVFSEGVMDAEAISTAWPFSYACLTNHINDLQAQFISMFTNKVVYYKDNDASGDFGSQKTVENLNRYNVKCTVSRMGKNLKDPGDVVYKMATSTDPEYINLLRQQIYQEIRSL